jgi:hypothetical protein
LSYNTQVNLFPAVLIAGMVGFKNEEFFAANDEERKDVKVELSK